MIFVSIDDDEARIYDVLCNEIFGEENFVATVIWQKSFRRDDAKHSRKFTITWSSTRIVTIC